MPIGQIKCAYCDFIANHPAEMEEHRDEVHDSEIDRFLEKEHERDSIRRYKKNNH